MGLALDPPDFQSLIFFRLFLLLAVSFFPIQNDSPADRFRFTLNDQVFLSDRSHTTVNKKCM
jgi:hypothetical protein